MYTVKPVEKKDSYIPFTAHNTLREAVEKRLSLKQTWGDIPLSIFDEYDYLVPASEILPILHEIRNEIKANLSFVEWQIIAVLGE